MKRIALIAAAASALAAPLAHAESQVVNGSGSAAAKLDFSITIARTLFLQIGSGTSMANNTAVDTIAYSLNSAHVATLGTSVIASTPSGDQGDGKVTVRVFGNNGNVTLNSGTTGAMLNATGDQIPWSEVLVNASTPTSGIATGFTATSITHPAFNTTGSGGNGTATTLNATGKMVKQQSTWTYLYANSAAYPAGTYGTTVANNGRVTYTASMP